MLIATHAPLDESTQEEERNGHEERERKEGRKDKEIKMGKDSSNCKAEK